LYDDALMVGDNRAEVDRYFNGLLGMVCVMRFEMC